MNGSTDQHNSITTPKKVSKGKKEKKKRCTSWLKKPLCRVSHSLVIVSHSDLADCFSPGSLAAA